LAGEPYFNWKRYIGITAIVVSTGIVVLVGVLAILNLAFIGNDLSNTVTFVVEIGIGVFISVSVLFYSKYQQEKSETLLADVKSISEKIERQRITMKETFEKAILNCLINIWKSDELILLNIRNVSAEEVVEPTGNKVVDDLVLTYKTQLLSYLEQLTSLTVLSSPVLNSDLITSLLDLKQQLEDNVVQKGKFRATNPWTAIIWRIDKLVKEYFPNDRERFSLKKIGTLLHGGMGKNVKEGR
jgi:hypothetical protein